MDAIRTMTMNIELLEAARERLDALALGFGGYSQIPVAVLGVAAAGLRNNGGAIFTSDTLDALFAAYDEYWVEYPLCDSGERDARRAYTNACEALNLPT